MCLFALCVSEDDVSGMMMIGNFITTDTIYVLTDMENKVDGKY